jgi:hypothetical protein
MFPPVAAPARGRQGRKERREALAARALADLDPWKTAMQLQASADAEVAVAHAAAPAE